MKIISHIFSYENITFNSGPPNVVSRAANAARSRSAAPVAADQPVHLLRFLRGRHVLFPHRVVDTLALIYSAPF